jgi:hypothetical protein
VNSSRVGIWKPAERELAERKPTERRPTERVMTTKHAGDENLEWRYIGTVPLHGALQN